MLKFKFLKRFIRVQVFLFMVSLVAATNAHALEAVCLRHKATDRIKTDCFKFQGKHDAFPRYECPDEKGKLITFELKNEWEETDMRYEAEPRNERKNSILDL